MPHVLHLLNDQFAVCRLAAAAAIPNWAGGEFTSISRTPEELSVVCREDDVPGDVNAERGWRCFRVAGPIAFTETGVVSGLTGVLADCKIGVFVVSTFDTDYILVKAEQMTESIDAWRTAGHVVSPED